MYWVLVLAVWLVALNAWASAWLRLGWDGVAFGLGVVCLLAVAGIAARLVPRVWEWIVWRDLRKGRRGRVVRRRSGPLS